MTNAKTQPGSHSTQDTAAIESLVAAETDAWNRGDAKAYSARFAAEGGFTNVIGVVYYGREAFEARHAEILKTIFKGSVLKQSIGKLRFIRPDVAIVDINAELTGLGRLPPGMKTDEDHIGHTKLQMVLVKENGEWWITAYHNVSVAPSGAAVS
jgi:uncharacterized protein (TIGR02246 family)